MARQLFVPNFEFEHQLGSRPITSLTRALSGINDAYASTLALAARDRDVVLLPGHISSEFFDFLSDHGLPRVAGLSAREFVSARRDAVLAGPSPVEEFEIRPWGWSKSVVGEVGEVVGAAIESPNLAAVERVNSRSFSFGLESELHCGLKGAARVESIDELIATIQTVGERSRPWIVKAEFSMSARERVLGSGTSPLESVVNWARKRLEGSRPVFVEPWVEIESEFGLQFDIAASGDVTFLGAAKLLTGRAGQYCGSSMTSRINDQSPDDALPPAFQPALKICRKAAMQIAACGYVGPLGIDSVAYRDANKRRHIRPLQDINARLTMGRLCLTLQCLLHPGERVRWLHGAFPDLGDARSISQLQSKLADQYRSARLVIPTTPAIVGDRPISRGTWAVIEPLDSQGTNHE